MKTNSFVRGILRIRVTVLCLAIVGLVVAEHPLHPEIAAVADGSFKEKEPPQIRGTGYVVKSLEAACRCPPEDCGGSPGYAEFVDAMADPKHEQHEEMKEWVGGAWDATRFSLEDTNAGLKRIKA